MSAFGREERAQSLVEFALVLPVILLLITGVFDAGRAVFQQNTLAYAAREGTRYAIVHGAGSTAPVGPGNVEPVIAIVRAAAVGVPDLTVTVTYPDSTCSQPNARFCRVAVEVTAPFVPIPSQYLLGSTFSITLRGGSMLVIQR